jgi:TM2 domain-containing membrane protein YozV
VVELKNKITASLLAFFLGGFGAHKFYLGQTSKGILYLLFFWTCIPAVIALIEFCVLLGMNEEQFNKKYN